nr:S6 family peptidase [Edwardsiella ictaluri]
MGGLAVPESYASIVSDEIPYSVFRDFAENKGVFQPGATDIAIYDKSGAKVGTLDLAPFPDFSSASTNTGFATLIAPQFIAGVAHNGGYTAVSFGYGNNYRLLDRNNHPDFDFHVPRLNKIVTEVVPIPMTTAGIAPGTYQNIDRFPVFYHIGSGVQYTKARGGALHRLSDSYQYLTGGTIGRPSISDTSIVSNPGDTFNPAYGPLANYSAPGDSGSPLYGYDAQEGRWVLVAVTRAYAGESGTTNWWVVVPVGFVQAEMAKYSDPAVTFQAGEGALHWTYDNSTNLGTLSQQGNSTAFTMHGQAGTDPNAGKSLTFTSDSGTTQGEIILESSINQGAGVLTFDADYAVRAQDQQTWMGGGLIISADKTLDWQVNGVSNDNLHRLGEGTLHINGQGVNPGGLNVGDGLTLLDQRPDAAGHVQAFSSLNIASGRPTVKLMADGQIDPDSISWGFRGGVLDLNGHDMAFQMLRMADYGARVTNSADARAQLSLNYQPLNYLSAVAYPLRGWTDARVGTPGDLYRYENGYTNTVDYFLLNTSGNYGYFPTNQTSNGPWTYLGHDEAGARQTLMLNEQRRNQIIHGQFSDNLDIVNIAEPGMTGTTVFDGSMAITGDFSQRGGSLQFQGHPVTHARDFSTGRPPVSADQPDWEARSFALNTLMLTQADFSLARNAVLLGDIQADASRVILNSNRVFVDSRDGEGVTSADTDVSEGQLSAEVVARSEHQGNILLENRSILAAGGLLSGAVTAANSLVALMADSEHTGDIATGDSLLWLAPGAVQLGDLQLGGASDLTSLGAIVGNLSVDASNALLERGSQLLGDITLVSNAALTSRGQTRRLLSADASAITLENGAEQQGDIRLDNGASLTSQGLTEGLLSADASSVTLQTGGRHTGVVTLNNGATLTIQAPVSEVESTDVGGQLRGDVILTAASSLISAGSIDGKLRAANSSLYLQQGSLHQGDIALSDGATLALNGRNQGAIDAEASLLTLGRSAGQMGDVALSQSLLISEGRSQGAVSLSDSGAYFGQDSQHWGNLSLEGSNARLALLPGAMLQGDLSVDGAGLLRFGVPPMPEIAIAATPPAAGPAVYRGRIAAPDARVEMRDTLWRMSGDSTLGSLLADDTLITAADGAFMTLTVDRLHADGALVALRADAEASDRLVINETLSGGNNTVLVNYLEPTLPEGRLNVSLISAPAGSDRESFTVNRQYMGFSEVMPELIVRESDSQLDWVLSGFDVAPDSGREEDAASLLSLNYRNFMAEVQYLDKRQLDLRNDPTDTGVWARVLHGAGSAAENYRDRYLHLQVGADRRYGLGETGDLLAGATFTFTDGRASGDGFSSKSRSLGAGLYATALHPSGMFVDLNAKYVHHSTEYQVSLAGLGERKADNHAWYARADVGYRYGLGEGAFVEPHLELVYGSYSATRFDWRDQGMAVSLAQPGFTPLLATAGVTLGQRFDIGEWQTTLRAGLDYQSELLSTGDTLLRDASGERTIRGERDSRLRYSLGIESRVGDGLQLGLEVERSSLGDYNLDYSVQATLRYRF